VAAVEGSPQTRPSGGTEFGPLPPPGVFDTDSLATCSVKLLKPSPAPEQQPQEPAQETVLFDEIGRPIITELISEPVISLGPPPSGYYPRVNYTLLHRSYEKKNR